MIKQYLVLVLSLLTSACYAEEYLHETQIINSQCRNIAVSTRVGHINNGACVYTGLETPAKGYDICGPFQLNAFILEKTVGQGFDCAATRVHFNERGDDTKEDLMDEFLLIQDTEGHYVSSQPFKGTVAPKYGKF